MIYLLLRLILRMERTTKPLGEVPYDAAIAAVITATSSLSSYAGAAGAAAGTGAAAGAGTGAASFSSFFFAAADPGMYLNREIRKISSASTTNTVPSPITVFSAAFLSVVASEYFILTLVDSGIIVSSNT